MVKTLPPMPLSDRHESVYTTVSPATELALTSPRTLPLVLILAACGQVVIPLTPTEPEVPDMSVVAPTGFADLYVDAAGGADSRTIQGAIDIAADGDWILVRAGSYREALNFGGKQLYISSADGSSATTIDASGNAYAVIASEGETSGTSVVGFTIEGARDGGAYVDFSSLHLEDVVFTGIGGNSTVFGTSADVELQDVLFEDNTASYAEIYMDRGSLQANNITLECGRGSYAFYHGHGHFIIDGGNITCSRGKYAYAGENAIGTFLRSNLTGAIYTQNEDDHPDDVVALYNTVLVGSYTAIYGNITIVNSVIDGGSVSYTNFEETPATPLLLNSVFLNSTCVLTSDAPSNSVYNNSFWNTTSNCTGTAYEGTNGNLSVDPEMVDAEGGDYHLSPGSPLEDAGYDDTTYDDVDGSRNDIGVYGGRYSLDGGW
jgi:hypothetical protein